MAAGARLAWCCRGRGVLRRQGRPPGSVLALPFTSWENVEPVSSSGKCSTWGLVPWDRRSSVIIPPQDCQRGHMTYSAAGPAAGPTPRCPGPCPGRLSQARTTGYSHRAHELGRSGHHHLENSLVFPKHILPDRLLAFLCGEMDGSAQKYVCLGGGWGGGKSTGTTM